MLVTPGGKQATMAALDAYSARVRLIAGGKGKGTPFGPVAERSVGVVVHAYLIGICRNLECPSLRTGGTDDHVHILCRH